MKNVHHLGPTKFEYNLLLNIRINKGSTLFLSQKNNYYE